MSDEPIESLNVIVDGHAYQARLVRHAGFGAGDAHVPPTPDEVRATAGWEVRLKDGSVHSLPVSFPAFPDNEEAVRELLATWIRELNSKRGLR